MIYSYDEMKEKTKEFYANLGCSIEEGKMELAVASLTMACYANEFSQKNQIHIQDHRALATVGDAVCEAFLMMKEYNISLTMKEMTDYKKSLTNKNLNDSGRKLLEERLFMSNNDLADQNTKSYATAFEAVIGFLSLVNIRIAEQVFNDKVITE